MTGVWATTYVRDRRGHAHKCRACWKNMKVGDRAVFMRLVITGKTWCIHEQCGQKIHNPLSGSLTTWADMFVVWSAEKKY